MAQEEMSEGGRREGMGQSVEQTPEGVCSLDFVVSQWRLQN